MKSAGRHLFARFGALTLALGFAQSALAAGLTQQQLGEFADNAQLRFSVVNNLAAKPEMQVTLRNDSSVALPAGKGDWRIYFHSVRKLDAAPDGLSLRHVQGDLHELAPTAGFKGLARGDSFQVPYTASASMVSYSDFMPRAF